MKIITFRQAGFTLVEIMIVVAIIGLLAAVAIPNFLRARSTSQQDVCINNLRQIDSAIQQWALESGASPTTTVFRTNIQDYMQRDQFPWCPLDSTKTFSVSYTIVNSSTAPACNIGTDPSYIHALQTGN